MTTSTSRVQALRARRKAEGLEPLELYVHPGDREAVKKHAQDLTKKRRKEATRG